MLDEADYQKVHRTCLKLEKMLKRNYSGRAFTISD